MIIFDYKLLSPYLRHKDIAIMVINVKKDLDLADVFVTLVLPISDHMRIIQMIVIGMFFACLEALGCLWQIAQFYPLKGIMTLSEQLPIKMKMHEPNQSFHPFEHIDHSQLICLLAVISYLLKSSDTTYTTTGRFKV